MSRSIAAGGLGFVTVTSILLIFPSALADVDAGLAVFGIAAAWAVLQPLASRLTASRRAGLRSRVIARSLRDATGPAPPHARGRIAGA